MYAVIVPFGKTFDEQGLTYKIPDSLLSGIVLGCLVAIPLKNNLEYGIVYKIVENTFDIDIKIEIRSIIEIKNNNLIINNYRLILLEFISINYFTPIHNSLNLFLPKNLKEKLINNKLDFFKTSNYNYNFEFDKSLTKNQENIFHDIINSNENKFLLFGVTGSGKTEIYIKLIQHYIKQDKQVLLLIPEIILGNQIYKKICQVFGDNVLLLNSTVSEAKKTNYFLDIYHNKAKIILGTRSALFYPFSSLGLIIIDEEHDNSYVSDQSPRYNSVEIANKITEINNNKMLLASGTPSINSMYKAVKGEYKLLNLLEKYKK
ncbi:MAG: DEAD/DEAH box helicase family protein [Candidatus Gracilibacteria bacterium]|nr:DEAD/DEAH box helicase family protein [Candidatus Gracilibacteria bacterium]